MLSAGRKLSGTVQHRKYLAVDQQMLDVGSDTAQARRKLQPVSVVVPMTQRRFDMNSYDGLSKSDFEDEAAIVA